MVQARRAAALVCALGLSGCYPITLTTTGPKQPPREPNCKFDVLTSPAQGYRELGVLDIPSERHRQTVRGFKHEVGPYVCKAGGDAVLAHVNGTGDYIKAIVLQRVEQPPARAAAPGTVPAWGPERPATSEGCKFDTQCKGDRICVEGACVNPPAAETQAAQ